MHRRPFLAAPLALAIPARAQQRTTITIATAGDQNMVDYITDFLGPRFEKQYPNVRVRAIGTGPGDAGSQRIKERLDAQKAQATTDVDVAVVHQFMAGAMVRDGMLERYRDAARTGTLATRDTSRVALGQDVDGYVLPMFHSQTALAYNPAIVRDPPQSFEALEAWVKANPKKFGYNGIRGGMSGVAFVFGWVGAFAPNGVQLTTGPYDPATRATWGPALARLKAFNGNVLITPGNAGTLDALNRGEIAIGPVWVDMFYSWQAEGRLSPDLRLVILGPGMPGQPMYYVIPARAAHAEAARAFIEFATSPEIQAEGIVKRFNWYPGIDAQHVRSHLSDADWNRLFRDIPPQTLADRGQQMPIAPYFREVQEAYEREVMN